MKLFLWSVGAFALIVAVLVILPNVYTPTPIEVVDTADVLQNINIERLVHAQTGLIEEPILTKAAQQAVSSVYSQNIANSVVVFNVVFDTREVEVFSGVASVYSFNSRDGVEMVDKWRKDPKNAALFDESTNVMGIGTALSKDGIPFVLVIYAHEAI